MSLLPLGQQSHSAAYGRVDRERVQNGSALSQGDPAPPSPVLVEEGPRYLTCCPQLSHLFKGGGSHALGWEEGIWLLFWPRLLLTLLWDQPISISPTSISLACFILIG